MRNISFSLTTEQFKARTKTVTRRLGWLFLKEGDELMACEKCMGLKPGEKIVRLGKIRVVDVRRERIFDICTSADPWGETRLEGFPKMAAVEFMQMFCKHMRCSPETLVTRIVFEYLENENSED